MSRQAGETTITQPKVPSAVPASNATAQDFAKFFAPVALPGFVVTQPFGQRPDGEFHTGIDIGVGGRTNVPAITVTDGTVVHAGFVTRPDGSPSYGNLVVVKDAEGYLHYYAHLAAFAVQQGQTIKAGTELGLVGATGRATGIHLHYEVRDPAGNPVDPSRDLQEPVQGHPEAPRFIMPTPAAQTTGKPLGPSDNLSNDPASGDAFHPDLGSFIPTNPGFDEETIGISHAVADRLGMSPLSRNDVARAVDAANLRLKAMGVSVGN